MNTWEIIGLVLLAGILGGLYEIAHEHAAVGNEIDQERDEE